MRDVQVVRRRSVERRRDDVRFGFGLTAAARPIAGRMGVVGCRTNARIPLVQIDGDGGSDGARRLGGGARRIGGGARRMGGGARRLGGEHGGAAVFSVFDAQFVGFHVTVRTARAAAHAQYVGRRYFGRSARALACRLFDAESSLEKVL